MLSDRGVRYTGGALYEGVPYTGGGRYTGGCLIRGWGEVLGRRSLRGPLSPCSMEAARNKQSINKH